MKKIVPLLILMLLACSDGFGRVPHNVNLWSGRDHGKGKVTMTVNLPDGNPRACVVVCPGGSYFWLDMKNEGFNTAKWLTDNGFAAFVLNYRTAGKFNFVTDFRFLYGGNRYPAMLQDAARCIEVIRDSSTLWGIDSCPVGIMGFSAGGHLALMTVKCGVDFVAAIYPVVTMSDRRYVHRRSRRALMGFRSRRKLLRDSLSMEKHIPHGCCPVFVVSCDDDKVVNPGNSVLLDSALTSCGVPHEYIRMPYGGHGFGVNPVEVDGKKYSWTGTFLSWMERMGF